MSYLFLGNEYCTLTPRYIMANYLHLEATNLMEYLDCVSFDIYSKN
jgi:hypothetical protein